MSAGRWSPAAVRIAAAVVAIGAGTYCVLLVLPSALIHGSTGLTPAERMTALNAGRVVVVQFVAAIGLGGSLLYAARTFGLTQRGQLSDRYSRSVEQIASPDPAVVIGGIYALEQLAKESDSYQPILRSILTALIHERAKEDLARVRPEVQIAAVVIARSKAHAHYLDLSGLHLRKIDLTGLDLRRANFAAAVLNGASFADCDLNGANFSHASLAEVNYSGANLSECRFSHSTIDEAQFHRSNVADAEFEGCDPAAALGLINALSRCSLKTTG